MRQLDLSHSSLAIGCERKFQFRKFHPMQRQSSGLAADVGTCLHIGYQEWLRTKDETTAIAAMMLDYPIMLNQNPMDDRSLEACYATMQNLIHSEMLQQYEIANINCLDGVTRPAIEVPFKIKLIDTWLDRNKTIPFVYIGFIDVMLYDRMTGLYTTADIKTHRNKQFDLSPLYQFSEQPIPYGLVLEHMIGGQIEQFDVGYISAYVDILEPRAQFYNFSKTQRDLEDWMLGLALRIRNYQTYYSLDFWPRNGNNCFSFFRTCHHFQYCSSRDTDTINAMMMRDVEAEDAAALKRQQEFKPWIEFEMRMAA